MDKPNISHVANDFTGQELMRGYKFRDGAKVYCCYGMCCDAGHSGDCVGRGLVLAESAQASAAQSGEKGATK